MTHPVRIQRKRTKGYDMQAESRAINGLECVYVGRPTKWGNPFVIEYGNNANAVKQYVNTRCADGYFIKMAQAELRGKNLACFCPLGQPCHADILLQLANE